MTNHNNISVLEALARLDKGESIKDSHINFKGAKVKALDAFKLGKEGIDVPDEVIFYNDDDIAYDPEFDDYEWERTDLDPLNDLKEKLTVSIEIKEDVKEWIQKNGIEVNHLMEALLQNFYSANQLIKGK
jgi:uncharacterized protein (DUF4415 family)